MNERLKQNILDLGTPARFMENNAGLSEEKISREQFTEKIPIELHYACIYWASHFAGANPKDTCLLHEVDVFIKQHLLHWLEALSWIRKLDVATDFLRVILPSMKSVSSYLYGIISDALLFIPKFYKLIRDFALHTYYSALPFTPTGSPLYTSHSGETAHCLCRPEGLLEQWDPLIANIEMHDPMFSNDSSKFCLTGYYEMRLLKAENGTLLRTFNGKCFSIADDFSVVAISHGSTVTLQSVASNSPITTVTHSDEVFKLVLSSDGSRLVAGLVNNTAVLWDILNGKPITSASCYRRDYCPLPFALAGHRLAFISVDGTMNVLNTQYGELVARFDYMSKKRPDLDFHLSRDGRCLASVIDEDAGYIFTLWDCEEGKSIGVIDDSHHHQWAISEDASHVAMQRKSSVQLWGGNPLSLLETLYVDTSNTSEEWEWCSRPHFSRGFLGFEVELDGELALKLYDVNNHTFLATLQVGTIRLPGHWALSPDLTRFADGGSLYDMSSLMASASDSDSTKRDRDFVSALSVSPDSTRLASGFINGTVQLWDIGHTEQPIAAHRLHLTQVSAVIFSIDSVWFASASNDGAVILWDSKNGAPIRRGERPAISWPFQMAASSNLLAVSEANKIVLFEHQSLRIVDTLESGNELLSFTADGSFLVTVRNHNGAAEVTVRNVDGWDTIDKFWVNSQIASLTISPDGSRLAARLDPKNSGRIQIFDVVNNRSIGRMGHRDLRWIPNFLSWAVISHALDKDHGHCIIGRFPGHLDWVPLLWMPPGFEIYSFSICPSMIALCSEGGRTLFIRI